MTSNILPTTKKKRNKFATLLTFAFSNGFTSGKLLHNYGNSPFLMGKSTFFFGHFQYSYVCLPEGTKNHSEMMVSCVSCRTSCSVCPLTTPPHALKRLFDLVGHAAGVAGAESAVRGILCGLEMLGAGRRSTR